MLLTVQIDIKPGDSLNSINLNSKGTEPVAILSSPNFDATKVNPSTVTVAGAPVTQKHPGKFMASVEDVNRDRRLDLVVHIRTEALQLNDKDIKATLNGQTFDGIAIIGNDMVRVIAPPKKPEKLKLISICSPEPQKYRVWRVLNLNQTAQPFSWNLFRWNKGQSGSGVVPAASGSRPGEMLFTTRTEWGVNIVGIFIHGVLQDIAVGNPTKC